MQTGGVFLDDLEIKLGYEFTDRSLLERALTHSSYANEIKKSRDMCNERLEFLGDSVLGMTVAEYLYLNMTKMPEGQMTRLRAEIVCEKSLADSANRLGLGKYLRLGKGEESGGGRSRPALLADAMEAVFAAVYLDGGREEAARLIRSCMLSQLRDGEYSNTDYKTALQELIQRKSGQVLTYNLIGESGPDHQKVFSVEVCLNGVRVGVGEGKSKKEAEQQGAREALSGMGACARSGASSPCSCRTSAVRTTVCSAISEAYRARRSPPTRRRSHARLRTR
jgi:ribonuclease-3